MRESIFIFLSKLPSIVGVVSGAAGQFHRKAYNKQLHEDRL
jgi:hypothetical protein